MSQLLLQHTDLCLCKECNAMQNTKYRIDAGYTIPVGWAVMVCPPAVHLNPEKYEDPLTFNPWRWEVGYI